MLHEYTCFYCGLMMMLTFMFAGDVICIRYAQSPALNVCATTAICRQGIAQQCSIDIMVLPATEPMQHVRYVRLIAVSSVLVYEMNASSGWSIHVGTLRWPLFRGPESGPEFERGPASTNCSRNVSGHVCVQCYMIIHFYGCDCGVMMTSTFMCDGNAMGSRHARS